MPYEPREPLDVREAKQRIQHILANGEVRFSRHAAQEMAADRLTTVDCVQVLRGGIVAPPEREHGSWRYRVRAGRICVVVAFRSATTLTVVTAWRITGR